MTTNADYTPEQSAALNKWAAEFMEPNPRSVRGIAKTGLSTSEPSCDGWFRVCRESLTDPVFQIAKDATSSLDLAAEVEAKVIEKVGQSRLLIALIRLFMSPNKIETAAVFATATQRIDACRMAVEAHEKEAPNDPTD